MRKRKLITGLLILFFIVVGPAAPNAAPRIKDICRIGGAESTQLIGYGLVVGLDGSGDSKGTQFTVHSVVNMLTRMGITVPENKVRTKNVAAVMVSASLPSTAREGMKVDVTVSSLGDAKSIQGGVLLMSPLADPDGNFRALAQGPVSVGGFKIGGEGGDAVGQNFTLVGRVPNGATVENTENLPAAALDFIDIALYTPDYTTASRVCEAIRERHADADIECVDAGLVRVAVPAEVKETGDVVTFIAGIENATVNPDAPAIVVINERTGTIVAGGNVTIGEVAIAHGNLSVEISARPLISQPSAFSRRGDTVVVPDSEVSVNVDYHQLYAMDEAASVADVARGLNALGVSPRDTIAIFQALKEAGALRAKIRIL
ncbi:MAG: flagellar basal body P-ring protein FlgI [bacterium]|jgi:flagellar P-ring protein precursor FlgI